MMRIFVTLLFMMMLAGMGAGIARAQEADGAIPPGVYDEPVPGTDVRGFIWGVPPEDVIKYERVVLYEKHDNALMFIDKVNGVKTLISYEFYQGKLWRVTYDVLKDSYPNPQHIIDDYVSMGIMLNKYYGEPVASDQFWNNDYYKDKPNRWGLAVFNGFLKLRMMWQNPRTDAVMTLESGESNKRTYKFRAVMASRAISAAMQQDEVNAALQPPLSAPEGQK